MRDKMMIVHKNSMIEVNKKMKRFISLTVQYPAGFVFWLFASGIVEKRLDCYLNLNKRQRE
jgi:hypothetical protein